MTFMKTAPLVLGVALVSVLLPTTIADQQDQKTTVTLSEPVQIPGVHLQGWGVLPPGTYVFKLMDSKSDRHIVQIFNQDETKLYATILAIPNYRLRPTDKTVITFNEGRSGRPDALRAWFYPGDSYGQEFVYPKNKAVELAKVANQPVLAETSDRAAEVGKPDEPGVVAELQTAQIVAVKPAGQEVEIGQVVQTTPEPAPEVAASEPAQSTPAPPQVTAQLSQLAPEPTQVSANRLPDTASSMPLIALFGCLALGGGLILWSIRRRVL